MWLIQTPNSTPDVPVSRGFGMTNANLRVGPGHAVGITEELISDVVHAFYTRIRADATLGPIFESVIDDNWNTHLAKMCDFWSSVLLMTGRFHGTPMAVHVKISELGPHHFALWLRMFRETVSDRCPPDAAELFVTKSKMIAQSLQLGIAHHRGELPDRRSLAQPSP
ncbi:group III truncated hemoglobin [Bosea spartocytisi]|nr:group III truncated hemoglobin [Bosea spartocytisi]